MYRVLRPTLLEADTDAPRRRVTDAARRGAIPAGRDPDLSERMRNPRLLDDARWELYKQGFTELKARVRGVYLGSQAYPEQPLFALEVTPLQRLPTNQPPNTATPYHISIAFFDPAKRREFAALEARYRKPRTVTLKGQIRGLAFYLDENRDPIARDKLLHRIFRAGHYGHKELHISL